MKMKSERHSLKSVCVKKTIPSQQKNWEERYFFNGLHNLTRLELVKSSIRTREADIAYITEMEKAIGQFAHPRNNSSYDNKERHQASKMVLKAPKLQTFQR